MLRLPRKKDHAFGFDPPAFGFDPLQNATPVTFWHVRVRFRPPVLKRGPNIARSVSTLGTRSVSTPSLLEQGPHHAKSQVPACIYLFIYVYLHIHREGEKEKERNIV